jgi:hypothetical protein
LTKFDFAKSIASGEWRNASAPLIGEEVAPVPVQNNTLVLPMANTDTGLTFFYNDGEISNIDLEFDIQIVLDSKLNKAGAIMDWDVTTAWCFLLALRDTYWQVPYWNPSETGSYTIMYHPRNGESLAHWSSSNRASKKGEVQWNKIPDIADGKWHTFRVAIEDVAGKTDKMKVIIAVDGNEYSNYEANKTSSKGYITFYNQSCSMQLRKSTGIKTVISSNPVSSSVSASKSQATSQSNSLSTIISSSTDSVAPSTESISESSQDTASSVSNSNGSQDSTTDSKESANSGDDTGNGNGSLPLIIGIVAVVLIGGGLASYFLVFKKK